jgi:Flp pilus assembly protein TadG
MRPRRSTEAESRKKGISKDGAALVEFAFMALLFFTLIFAIIEFSRLMLMYHHVGNAAREGSRYAIVHGSSDNTSIADEQNVEDYVRSVSALDPNHVFVTTTWPNGNKNPGSPVKVTVDYTFNFNLPILFGSGIPLRSTSKMVISY